MNPNLSTLLLTSPLVGAPLELLRDIVAILGQILKLVESFRANGPTPQATRDFETDLTTLLRPLGRHIVEWTYNNLEPDEPALLPHQLMFEDAHYLRRGKKSKRRRSVWTLFGPITLVRCWYRHGYDVEPALFPLEINLGIEPGGATPALALRAAWLSADATQQKVLDILKEDHGVTWAVKTLRKTVESVSASMSGHRHEVQTARLLQLLGEADQSRGKHKIVLSVGRDGIFVPIHKGRKYQEAVTATVAVYDRMGKRLGTVYLGRMPEPQQTTLSEQWTRLISGVLDQWDGPLPRLCYVTDAGHHPTEYFQKTLRPMRHPRTGKPLHWEWVVDYFHVCGYITKLAEALFGEGKEAFAWAKKMRHWLKAKPNGAYRVLHSAAAMKAKHGLHGPSKQYADAYRYLRNRLDFLDYVDYRRRGLPIGSGVTEAACKIVFTQRFKQSGMAWTIAGGQIILDLRLLRLSKTWDEAQDAYLRAKPTLLLHPTTKYQKNTLQLKIAA